MKPTDSKTITLVFNECINSRDLAGLDESMTDDHNFIDTENNQISGKQNCLNAWEQFFQMFPDYKNIFDVVTLRDNMVIITGHSICSDKRLEGPAIWTAKMKENKISEWRVFKDNTDTRQKLGIIS